MWSLLIACHCCIAVYVAYSHADRIPIFIAEKHEETEDDELCYACFDSRPNTMLLGCGHHGLCTACVKTLWDVDKRCPLCRAELKGVAFLDWISVLLHFADVIRSCVQITRAWHWRTLSITSKKQACTGHAQPVNPELSTNPWVKPLNSYRVEDPLESIDSR